MSGLYCPTGTRATFPPPAPPAKRERGDARPPDTSRDVCEHCGLLAWQHWTVRPEVGA